MLDHSYYLVFTGLHTAEKKYVLLVLRIGFTFMLDLNIVLMEAFLKMLPILSVSKGVLHMVEVTVVFLLGVF